MQEDSKQKISQLMDDELDRHEALILLKKIWSNPDLKEKLVRYETISQVLKNEFMLIPDPDFSAKISQKIKQEPAYLLPQTREFRRSHKLLATAASLALIAMFAGLNMDNSREDVKTASAIQSPVTVAANRGVPERQRNQNPVNKQINDYLQAHNSSVYTNGQANFQPYARVTAYSQK